MYLLIFIIYVYMYRRKQSFFAYFQNNLISQEVWERLKKPTELVLDHVGKLEKHRGYGFFYNPHPIKHGVSWILLKVVH